MRQLMGSFRGFTAPTDVLEAVRRGSLACFCLFAYNVKSPAQVRALADQLRAAAREGGQPVPLIGIDQEGGQLMAVGEGVTDLPGNMALGATGSPELAYQVGAVLGRELLAMGLNLNFAPSVDVNSDPRNPAIGIRAFGDDPALVGTLGAALIRGMQAQGVIATAKHFPGMGAITFDTHHAAAQVDSSLADLEQRELLPFHVAIEARVGAIMTAHLSIPQLDPVYPATLSRTILSGLLRERMGYDGLIITDAMDMYAVARYGAVESVGAALAAGADLALLGHLPDQMGLHAHFAASENPLAVQRLQRAQVFAAAQPLELSSLDNADHRAIAREVAERSITVVKDSGALPLRLSADTEIAVITPTPRNLTPADTSASLTITLADAIRRHHARTQSYQFAGDGAVSLAEAVQAADVVIVGTISAQPDDAQAALVKRLIANGKRPIVIALRTPYDLAAFPEVETYLCTYSIRAVSMEATARVLFGEIEPRGRLPCTVQHTSAME